MVEVLCVDGPCVGRRVMVETELPHAPVPLLLITVDGFRYVRAPDYGRAARDGWEYVSLY